MTRTPLEFWIAEKIGADDTQHLTSYLAEYQLSMVQETLRYASRRSPFYRRHLKNAPHTISKLQDISSLPFTTADDIKESGMQFLCVSQGEIERVVTLQSTGTTGKPKRLYFTAADIEHTLDFFAVGMSTFTRPGDRVLILLPGELPDSVGDLLARSLERINACGIKHGPVQDISNTLAVIEQERITSVVGIPTQVLRLARCSRNLPISIKSVLLTTDYVPEAIREAVEEAWNCRVYNHYGMTEMGLGGGLDCAARQGYHVREADFYFEIVDTVTGASLPDGEPGEVVFTTLTRTGMPLIRYRTGDCSRIIAEPCPCGTMLRRMEHVQGRFSQSISLGCGHQLTMQALDEALFPIIDIINYKPSVSQVEDSLVLHLAVMSTDADRKALSQNINEALWLSPALQPALAEGSLSVGAITFTEENGFTEGVIKRIIETLSALHASPVEGHHALQTSQGHGHDSF